MTKYNLERVTITGADGNSNIERLMEISQEFPFVEWGILVSRRAEGTPRFPGREWIDEFVEVCQAQDTPIDVSMHVCGAWVRQMLVGDLEWSELPSVRHICQRVQINTHAELHKSTTGLWKSLKEQIDKEFIFQWDGINDHLTYAAFAGGLKVAALFDTSGGAGILPLSWPKPIKSFPCGYAGGLGPENVAQQLRNIGRVCDQPFWIDMERNVRTFNDAGLDIASVRKVLHIAKQFLRVDKRSAEEVHGEGPIASTQRR
jgi:hypothetical protein